MATGMSSQCVGPGASHNENMPAIGNQYFAVMLLLEAKITSNFTISVNYMLFIIAEFTDNKTATGRILILTDNPKIPAIHHRSVVYLSINYSHQNACILRVPPTSPWLPILLIHVGSEDKVINWKHLQKINISKYCSHLFMRHACWGCLMWCINMKWIQQVS